MKQLAIFDMDDTLYQSEKFKEIFNYSVYDSVAEKMQLTINEAKTLFEEKRKIIFKQTGLFPGKTQTLYLYYGISIDEFERKKLQSIKKIGMPVLNPPELSLRLKTAIEKLHKKYCTIVFTNNHKSITDNVLSDIHLNNVFNKIYTLNDMPKELSSRIKDPEAPVDETDEKVISYIKPSLSRLKDILKDYNVKPENCVSIGDRYYIDHIYAEQLGMKIFMVESVEDVIRTCEALSNND